MDGAARRRTTTLQADAWRQQRGTTNVERLFRKGTTNQIRMFQNRAKGLNWGEEGTSDMTAVVLTALRGIHVDASCCCSNNQGSNTRKTFQDGVRDDCKVSQVQVRSCAGGC
jgi:hypothetical protein